MRAVFLKFIALYQRYITLLSFGSCRYYPSCSEYAKQQFQTNNFFLAIYYSILRILRCNQLFIGGIDYPIVPYEKIFSLKKIVWSKMRIKFWFVPKDKKYCYIIKQFK